MKDGCKGDGSCGRKEKGECDGACAHDHHSHEHHGNKHHDPEQIDISSLGPEAIELVSMFDEINDHLVEALKTRKKILEALHNASKSKELKEKMDKVVSSRHPVLVQFVFSE
jgi:hypothetical protein